MREKIMETWKKENLICKIAYILTCVLFFWIPFEGLVLESLNLHLLGYEGVRILVYLHDHLRNSCQEVEISFAGCSRYISCLGRNTGAIRGVVVLSENMVRDRHFLSVSGHHNYKKNNR